ncbi:RagB/SusD family nutrient uptake outer membrane protein [Chitinophaga sp. sic0106]|uniref:RagB/SusD family nutrient uptake outer membrane protein n=1 Tax=Chitinophaga sp. sic0106 TaxID=2854785 RepID=UPI001C44182B|nr:RagB/SusD family nutrient uptake outer membrane protein [Chitinophaga sp. sic0106]MBV7531203.1 RagB/SusD family nutrient uptake outer membrane protein [Chitinophaga sp. sic0106]
MRNKIRYIIYGGLLLVNLSACKKLIEVDQPISTVSTESVFSSDEKASNAVAGVYSSMINDRSETGILNSVLDVYTSLLSGECQPYIQTSGSAYDAYYNGHLLNTDGVSNFFWQNGYKIIYNANAVMEGIANSTSLDLTAPARARYRGEMLFSRAIAYFMLVNLYGDVPLVLTTDINQNIARGRAPLADVYHQMELDLTDAITLMEGSDAETNTNKYYPTKYAAKALLSRVYLFQEKWDKAAEFADAVINAGKFSLEPLNKVFKHANKESIWVLHQEMNTPKSLLAGYHFLPVVSSTAIPELDEYMKDSTTYELMLAGGIYPIIGATNELVNSFEANDQRSKAWLGHVLSPDVAPYNGYIFYYPEKYMGPDRDVKDPILDLIMLRLGEVYLIRAEANAHLNKLTEAVADINVIRNRAGLGNVSPEGQDAVLQAVAQERKVELFAENSSRFFDLKRTGKAKEVLGALSYKQPFAEYTLLLPIPAPDLSKSPVIKQNPGY